MLLVNEWTKVADPSTRGIFNEALRHWSDGMNKNSFMLTIRTIQYSTGNIFHADNTYHSV